MRGPVPPQAPQNDAYVSMAVHSKPHITVSCPWYALVCTYSTITLSRIWSPHCNDSQFGIYLSSEPSIDERPSYWTPLCHQRSLSVPKFYHYCNSSSFLKPPWASGEMLENPPVTNCGFVYLLFTWHVCGWVDWSHTVHSGS